MKRIKLPDGALLLYMPLIVLLRDQRRLETITGTIS